jgi:thymidylate kinase
MILLFEGPDNVGKSTQIKKILKYFIDKPTFVIHFSGIPGISPDTSRLYSEIMYNDMFKLMSQSHENNRNLIFDRSHIGEAVYAPIFRNYSGDFVFDIERSYQFTDVFQTIKLFIFVDEPENLINREDGNSFSVDPGIKQQEIDLFKEAYRKSLIPKKYFININGKSIDTVHLIIQQTLFGDLFTVETK